MSLKFALCDFIIPILYWFHKVSPRSHQVSFTSNLLVPTPEVDVFYTYFQHWLGYMDNMEGLTKFPTLHD